MINLIWKLQGMIDSTNASLKLFDFCLCFIIFSLFNSKDWDDQKVKTAIKKLLEFYSQTHLERMLCPFSQVST